MWKGVPFAALAVLAAAMMSCGGSGKAEPKATPTITPTATGAGFLPTWTPGATFTEVPTATPLPTGVRGGAYGPCPPNPMILCARPGDTINLYRELPIARASSLRVGYPDSDWVLDPVKIESLARMLDHDVVLMPYVQRGSDEGLLGLYVRWNADDALKLPSGDSIKEAPLTIDLQRNVVRSAPLQLEAPLPDGFVDALLASVSPVDATPSAVPPPETPTPTVAPREPFFQHPEGWLSWDGPDGRVRSIGPSHCGIPDPAYGVPTHISVENAIGFWGVKRVARGDDWRWTGYHHGDWQIWQGDDPTIVYVVNTREPDIAWEYRWFGCR
jgi:hypothetical protein